MRRLVLLTAGLAALIYVWQWLAGEIMTWLDKSLVEHAWVYWVPMLALVLVAVVLVVRWRGVGGSPLAFSAILVLPAVYTVWAVTSAALSAIPGIGGLNNEVALAISYLALAAEAVAVAWVVAGFARGWVAHRTSASSGRAQGSR